MITQHLSPAPPLALKGAAYRAARRDARRINRDYAGGLPAEIQSRGAAIAATRATLRRSVLPHMSRRIDLLALLSQLRPDFQPIWALADPTTTLADNKSRNGLVFRNYSELIFYVGTDRAVEIPQPNRGVASFRPTGLPPLPPRVRELAAAPTIRRRAKWVGVLWQPEEWLASKADPALVVEWRDLPGEYYCLAVWGHDGPAIMEFVD